MSDHSKPIANSAQLVIETGDEMRRLLCDHQAFFVIVFDDHAASMPVIEDLLRRPSGERKRAADALRMWAARIESGTAPLPVKA